MKKIILIFSLLLLSPMHFIQGQSAKNILLDHYCSFDEFNQNGVETFSGIKFYYKYDYTLNSYYPAIDYFDEGELQDRQTKKIIRSLEVLDFSKIKRGEKSALISSPYEGSEKMSSIRNVLKIEFFDGNDSSTLLFGYSIREEIITGALLGESGSFVSRFKIKN